jgi:hypothetical protein
MTDDEREASYKREELSKKWVELVGFEDEYFIQEFNGLCVKKKSYGDSPDNVHCGSHKYVTTYRDRDGWEKWRLKKNGVVSHHYVAVLLAKTFLPNPNNYKYVQWEYKRAWFYIDEISWVEFKTPNSRQAIFD